MTDSILDALLAQYVTPYQGGQGPQMSPMPQGAPGMAAPGPQMSPAPQMGGAQPPMPQAGPPTAPGPAQSAPAEQQIAEALMSGVDTQASQAVQAFDEGAAPFEQKYANTQERRFKGGLMGLGETIYDMVQEKKLAPQKQAVDAARKRLSREQAVEASDQKYKDAKAIIGDRNSDLPPDVVDAMSRRYAQGEDLSKLAADTNITPYQQAQLDMKERDYAYTQMRSVIESNQGLAADKKGEAVDLSKRIEPSLGRYSKAQEVQGRLLSVVDDYKNSSAPVDIQVMYDFIKSIDPDSVVREGEVRLTESGMGYQTLVQNALDKFKQDQVVPADFMAGLANQAMQINEGLQESAQRDLGRYYNMARNNGYDMMDVFGNESLADSAREAAEHNYALREATTITGEQIDDSRNDVDAEEDAAIPKVNSIAEALKLPAGTVFIDANGIKRIR